MFSMSSDLSVPFSFIANLECVKRLTRDKRVVKQCLSASGVGYDPGTELIRPVLQIPRMKLYIRSVLSKEELSSYIAHEYISLHRDPTFTWLLLLRTEELALNCYYSLRDLGFNVGIESTFPYCHLLEKVEGLGPALKNSSFFAMLKPYTGASTGKLYSFEEICSVFSTFAPTTPVSFKYMACVSPIIKKSPYTSLKL